MIIGKCYHIDGTEMQSDFQIMEFAELAELLNRVNCEKLPNNLPISA